MLTGETGAGKSILLDALGLLLGDRFEQRQLRPGAERAELAGDIRRRRRARRRAWLAAEALDAGDELLLRRVQDAQGRSRAWINGRPATLAQLAALGAQLLDLHGQHAHQALAGAEAQRDLLDEFGGSLVARARGRRCVAHVARRDRAARRGRDGRAGDCGRARRARRAPAASSPRSASGPTEWAELSAAQRRLANAAGLIEATTQAEDALTEGDDALSRRLLQLVQKLRQASADDPALAEVVALLEPAAIQLDEAARALRDYRRRLDLDPDELARVEQRLSAIHDSRASTARGPTSCTRSQQTIALRLSELADATDAQALATRGRGRGQALRRARRRADGEARRGRARR